ncbi:golgin subfamily A member 7 isoform X2 [Mycetomoellerius zeteki]|uniref:golgin subfamily A member 7 isoform X2 n=1 Tax=Mycetomoellerius zeteki TaxID=64791 RepID=UPI00084E5AD1|nr:PREDICTED: golgin subfamily A member 7 isoform X2 [Trachymyrmex zeteki]
MPLCFAWSSVLRSSLENQFPASRFLIEERLWLRNGTRMRLPVLTISEGNHAALTPLEDMSAGRGQAGGGPPQNCEKVFIQRDYSEGTMVKFQTRFPTELESRLDRQLFEYTINQLNNYFAEAERASCSTYCESCLYCLTGYLISICTETHYEKCLRKVAKFISEQNDRVYKPRGLLLTDPTTRGLRLIEISVLDRPAS